jgi:hypothetical protein
MDEIVIDAQEVIDRYRKIVSEQLNVIVMLETQLEAYTKRILELEGSK